MTESRRQCIEQLADLIAAVAVPHPTRVAIDGVDTAGKTTLADELAGPLTNRGREVIRASVDGFHQPRVVRYQAGPDSAEGYFQHAYDYATLRTALLDPLGPDGNRWYRSAAFDFRTDTRLDVAPRQATDNAVLLLDGVFLLRPELRPYWDFTVFVDVSFDVVVQRARLRDAELFGSPDAVSERYHRKYIPAQQRYLDGCTPREHADVIVVNDDPEIPSLVIPARGRWRTDHGGSH